MTLTPVPPAARTGENGAEPSVPDARAGQELPRGVTLSASGLGAVVSSPEADFVGRAVCGARRAEAGAGLRGRPETLDAVPLPVHRPRT